MINRPPRAQGLAANISNPQAANLARQINNGGDVRTLVKEAIVDAQIHKDWSRVAAIENSLLRVDDRTIARHLGAVGTRAVVLSRTDEGGLAARIPEGYQHGLAWLVCLLFVRLDSDIETARAISKSFWSKARAVGGFGVDWGSTPLCFPPFAFGGPSRILLTESVGRGETSFLYEIRDFTARSVLAQENASTGGITSLAHILWGTVVTGTNDPLADLFNEDIWCPGFDHPAFAPEMTRLLAEASTGYDGDTFIHPECMPAPVANDFARSMVNEQVISQVIEGRLKPTLGEQLEGASVRISKLVPNSLPYMDQLLISIWTRANILVQTLRIPRTGNPLEADAQTIADFCRAQGIKNVFMPELASPIPAQAYSEESDDDDADEVFLIDGVLVQRWEEAGVQHLQLDGFITRGPVDGSDPFLTEVATLNVVVGETSTLADLYSQMDLADGVLKQALDLYAGVMLYMNSRDARVQRKDEHAEAAAALAALNRKKRRKEHYQRLNSSVDAIHVGPETVSAEGEGLKLAHGRHGVKPHYRRGFVRFNQRFGKGRLQTRPVLIPPVLVNAHKLAGDSPGKKQYVVGSSRTDEK